MEIREEIAAKEHEQWAHWTQYFILHCTPENIKKWTLQVDTPYELLTESEKEADRKWADIVISLLSTEYSKQPSGLESVSECTECDRGILKDVNGEILLDPKACTDALWEFFCKEVTKSYITSCVCDRCKKEFNKQYDIYEFQEMSHISYEGGYGSIFGDEVIIECDICQHCLKELLGKFIRLT